MNIPLHGWISYHSSLSVAFKLNLGQNMKPLLIEVKAAVRKDIAEHIIRPAKVIPTWLVSVIDSPLLLNKLKLWSDPMKIKVWCMRREIENRMTVVLM
jgi:hypothetical protein